MEWMRVFPLAAVMTAAAGHEVLGLRGPAETPLSVRQVLGVLRHGWGLPAVAKLPQVVQDALFDTVSLVTVLVGAAHVIHLREKRDGKGKEL